MSQFIASIDNREIAVAFWLVVVLLACAFHDKIRGSLIGVVRAFFVRSIVFAVSLLAGYLAVVVGVLAQLDLWVLSQLKLTILWFATVGVIGLFSVSKLSQKPELFESSAKNNFKITAVFEFFVNLYRMPLSAELVFVPFAALLGAFIAVAESRDEYSPAGKFFNGLAVLVGTLLLVYAVWQTATGFDQVASVDTIRSFTLPIIFSLLLLPFLWCMAVCVAYEEVFVRLKFIIKDEALHPYVKRRLVVKFRGNIRYVRAWFRAAWFRNFETKDDVDASIQPLLDGVSAI